MFLHVPLIQYLNLSLIQQRSPNVSVLIGHFEEIFLSNLAIPLFLPSQLRPKRTKPPKPLTNGSDHCQTE